ncbi:MAG: hypothetical protein NTY90_04630 [Candidatus Micrarchaeota archaeon]|nr:hypothetical protein [Candidatus Micrarchaeota archaeon]
MVLDEFLAAKVKQMFGGNLSKGINALLYEHLFREKKKSMFGALKGRVSAKDLGELRREEERTEKEHEKIYR